MVGIGIKFEEKASCGSHESPFFNALSLSCHLFTVAPCVYSASGPEALSRARTC